MAQIEVKESALDRLKTFGDHEAHDISSKFSIYLKPSVSYLELTDAKRRLINTIWDKEQQRREKKLHEGLILSAISYDTHGLYGQFVPYRYYLAQICDPSLKTDLKIVPVSINGMTYVGENLIVAKRACWVTQHPKKYELAPSGGVHPPPPNLHRVDIKGQLLEELIEEIGIVHNEVKSIKYFSLIRDRKEDLIEICAEIRLKSPTVTLASSSEYPQIMTIPCQELEAFIKNHHEEFVPLSLTLLKVKKII